MQQKTKIDIVTHALQISHRYINSRTFRLNLLLNNISLQYNTFHLNIIIIFQMFWPNNNSLIPNDDFTKINLSQNTPNQLPQPSPFLNNYRMRFNSFNSSFVSPMRLIQSPNICDVENFFEFQLKPTQKLEKFKLNEDECEQNGVEHMDENDKQQSDEDSYNINELDLSHKSIIQSIVNNLGINDNEIQKTKKQIANSNQPILSTIYDILIKKFKKLKKTKQQMTKYCIRKAFRFLSQKIRKQSASLGLKDNGDCLNYYFNKFQNDKTFTIPFKKNSIDKTMNSSFLSKIFSCPLFVQDYKKYLKIFKNQAQKDNDKKMNALTKIIDKTIQSKNLKKLQNFKRLPWTLIIVNKTYQLANSFLQYAKQSNEKQQADKKIQSNKDVKEEPKPKEEKISCPQIKKKSIILLTPPFGPLSSPLLQQKKLEDISKYC